MRDERKRTEKRGRRPSTDLSPLLQAWKYEEGRTVRRVRTKSGREVIQVRLPLGIEQYELHGRPDGLRPQERESWFAYYQELAEKAPWDFHLDEEAFGNLYQESLLYYYRYLLFFQIGEYKLCARDTLRNIEVLDFVSRYAPEELSTLLEQYRPYILRMHVIARALDRYRNQDDLEGALRLLEKGRRTIERLPPLAANEVFELEKERSLKSIDDVLSELRAELPPSPQRELEERLEEAIAEERYEEAARIRDELEKIREESGSG